MKQSQFEKQHGAEWQAFSEALQALERGQPLDPESIAVFPLNYRRLCQHLAFAQSRGYSMQFVDHLQLLVQRGHHQLYRHRSPLAGRLLGFFLGGFGRLVRKEWRCLAAASLLFYLSLLGMAALVLVYPELIYSLVSPEQVAEMEAMYDPDASRLGRFGERASSEDWVMFGYYVMHNIGIAFQTFAGGLLFGLGSIFYLLFNGLVIGAIAGHLTGIGYDQPFWSFVIGHGAFELTAITLAGAAGLKVGVALIAPGRHRRSEALRLAATVAIRLIAGAILFLLIAAFIEAYWSSMTYPSAQVKYAVGALLWLSVGFYLLRSGRGTHAPE